MIWLRHELWEYHDGFAYRLASKAETDRLSAAHPEGHLRQVFYAPSPAAAEAQYCALRGIGPYILNNSDSEAAFTMSQLESQLADFPDDHRLARQPALPEPEGGHPPAPAPAADDAPAPAQGAHEAEPDHHEPDPEPELNEAQGHAVTAPEVENPEHVENAEGAEPEAAFHISEAPAQVEPAHQDETPEPEPSAPHDTAATEILPPTPTTEAYAPRWVARRRKPNPFLGFLKLVWLLIVVGAVIVGVGIATGTLDGPTLLAQARELPAQIRDHSFLRTLVPAVRS